MQIGAIDNTGLGLGRGHLSDHAVNDGRFEQLLRAQPEGDSELREQAELLLGHTLFLPLLKQMRNDPFKSELMHGGFGEDAFANQFDQLIAERMARRVDYPLTDAVERSIVNRHENKGLNAVG